MILKYYIIFIDGRLTNQCSFAFGELPNYILRIIHSLIDPFISRCFQTGKGFVSHWLEFNQQFVDVKPIRFLIYKKKELTCDSSL